MAGANTNTQVVNLDFDTLKGSFISFLQSQSAFKDYNFEGSTLNTLVDLLTYNTQYNAYYLNMVANEMFLDSAVQRSSVVSQAKVLNYTPKSAIAPTATVDVIFNSVGVSSLTLPAYLNFGSAAINGVNYTFVNPDSYTVNVVNNTATFKNVSIKQGVHATYNFTVNSTTNPTYTFKIPDTAIDTTTLKVVVQASSSNSSYDIYNQAVDYLLLDSTSKVYFLEEALDGNYQLSFGDGIIGKQLQDGNIVGVSYLSTEGTSGAGANSFVLMNTVSGYAPSSVNSVTPASQGGDKESIDSIKFQAPKTYAAQGRAVTTEDYITAIQQNKLGFSFDAVNVWGGQDNDPPVYGQIFVCLKPAGSYVLTETQKQLIIQNIIRPISVVTVEPTILDPDYNYVKINTKVVYDPKKTVASANQISSVVASTISNFGLSTLNTFNSTFSSSKLTTDIQASDPSIITNEISIQLQKKFNPSLTNITTYKLYFGTELKKGTFLSGVNSSPAMQFRDPNNLANIIDGVYIEEVPSATSGVDTISLINPGYSYQYTPTITILGDGTGATATATISTSGAIISINVTNSGNNYTSAIVTITPEANDTTGQGGAAVVNLQGRYGTLRTYYNNNTSRVKQILNSNAGTIDYINGIITLDEFSPLQIDNPLGQLTISVTPASTIVSSSLSRIVTLDPFDSNAITVNVIAKNS